MSSDHVSEILWRCVAWHAIENHSWSPLQLGVAHGDGVVARTYLFCPARQLLDNNLLELVLAEWEKVQDLGDAPKKLVALKVLAKDGIHRVLHKLLGQRLFQPMGREMLLLLATERLG